MAAHTDDIDSCDACDEPIAFMVYAAYDVDPSNLHPLMARYPGAMFRACHGCLAGLMRADSRAVGTSGQYVVKVVPA